MFLGKIRGKIFLTQIWVFGSFFVGGQKIFYWSPAFRICTGCLPKYEWKIGFKTTYFQVFPGFPAIPASSQISQTQAKFGSILAKKGQFSRLKRLGFLQKFRKFQCAVFEKMLKTSIFGHFGPKRPILDHLWPKRGHFRIFGEKAKTSLFYSFFFHFSIQKIRKF